MSRRCSLSSCEGHLVSDFRKVATVIRSQVPSYLLGQPSPALTCSGCSVACHGGRSRDTADKADSACFWSPRGSESLGNLGPAHIAADFEHSVGEEFWLYCCSGLELLGMLRKPRANPSRNHLESQVAQNERPLQPGVAHTLVHTYNETSSKCQTLTSEPVSSRVLQLASQQSSVSLSEVSAGNAQRIGSS